MPSRASTLAPPTFTPSLTAGLSPSTVRPSIVTLSACTKITMLAPAQIEEGSFGLPQVGLDTAGTTTGLPLPCSVTALLTTTFSAYVPGWIVITAPGLAAAIAALMLAEQPPLPPGLTQSGEAAGDAPAGTAAEKAAPAKNARAVTPCRSRAGSFRPACRGMWGNSSQKSLQCNKIPVCWRIVTRWQDHRTVTRLADLCRFTP